MRAEIAYILAEESSELDGILTMCLEDIKNAAKSGKFEIEKRYDYMDEYTGKGMYWKLKWLGYNVEYSHHGGSMDGPGGAFLDIDWKNKKEDNE